MRKRAASLTVAAIKPKHPSYHALKVTATNQSAHPTKPPLINGMGRGTAFGGGRDNTYLTSLVRNINFTARASSLSCHPERRAKPAVEPEGRCIASGSKEHYQRLALAKGELYRFPRSCSVTPRTAPRFDSACAPLRMTRVGAIRLVNLMNNEVASLINDG